MKNIIHNKMKCTVCITVLFFVALVMACAKKENELSLPRQFSPTSVTTTNGDTLVTITWPASLFTLSGKVTYSIEVYNATDSTFANLVYSTTTTKDSLILTDQTLVIKQSYVARIKALGQGSTKDSNWQISSSFKILGEQLLNPITAANVIDVAVRLSWVQTAEQLTQIVLTTAAHDTIKVNITPTIQAEGMIEVDNLTPGTMYTANIYSDDKNKGTQVFSTVADPTGNVVDLRGISLTSRPTILTDTLPQIPARSIVLLKRGETYPISTSYNFTQGVTIQSGVDFGTNLAVISIGYGTTSGNFSFNFAASSTIDSIVFRSLLIKGGKPNMASYGADYLINANNAATVGLVKFDGCTIKLLRGLMRAQAGGTGVQVTNYIVNNCLMDSIREYGVVATSSASVVDNITITNSTLYRARKFIALGVKGTLSIIINNCTFNELPAGAATASNYVIALGSSSNTVANGITINNTIFGMPWNETGAGTAFYGIQGATTPTINNSYNTSDFVQTSPAIGGFNGLPQTASALFTNPSEGIFTFSGSFIGASSSGDPRWR